MDFNVEKSRNIFFKYPNIEQAFENKKLALNIW